MLAYSQTELNSIYELGRLYYEMGYFAPAERLFTGLSAVALIYKNKKFAYGF